MLGEYNFKDVERLGPLKINDKVIIRHVASEEEAQALAGFLWNEKCRHEEDIKVIDRDLEELRRLWKVVPRKIRAFVKP